MSRLELLYNDSLDEVGKLKSEYEAKLIEANDKFRNTKVENEQLKEKVDVLFKLGRSYLNRKENREHEARKEPEEEIETVSIEVVTVEEDNVEDVIDEDLQSWTKNKLRGFKRAGPASKAEKKTETNPSTKSSPANNLSSRERISESLPKPESNSTSSALDEGQDTSGNNRNRDQQSEKYCHYYVNKGRCNYQEMTGLKCKFEHKVAPMCNFGMSCSRHKCMFSHPKANGQKSFLGGNQMMMNPWLGQMMNPWMQAPPNQFFQNQRQTERQMNQ